MNFVLVDSRLLTSEINNEFFSPVELIMVLKNDLLTLKLLVLLVSIIQNKN